MRITSKACVGVPMSKVVWARARVPCPVMGMASVCVLAHALLPPPVTTRKHTHTQHGAGLKMGHIKRERVHALFVTAASQCYLVEPVEHLCGVGGEVPELVEHAGHVGECPACADRRRGTGKAEKSWIERGKRREVWQVSKRTN